MAVDEYLRAHFDGADRDFVEGEVFERNKGEAEHSIVQGELIRRLFAASAALGLEVRPEIRLQTLPNRFRVADIAVWRAPAAPRRGIAASSPFLVIEILSPEDRMVRVQPKVQEYLSMGASFVWVVDPYERQALVYTSDAPGGPASATLDTRAPDLSIELSDLWAALDA